MLTCIKFNIILAGFTNVTMKNNNNFKVCFGVLGRGDQKNIQGYISHLNALIACSTVKAHRNDHIS